LNFPSINDLIGIWSFPYFEFIKYICRFGEFLVYFYTNLIGSFIKNSVAEDPIESDKVTKDEFYQVYQRYCTQNKLAVESKENFGRVLKKKYQYQDWREA
jgi:hypothetical protein